MTDYTKSSKQRLMEALTAANPKYPIALDDVVFGLPSVTTYTGRNTKITLTPLSGKFTGKRTILYNRLDLSTFFDILGVSAINDIGSATTTHELLPLILSLHSVRLLPEEIINEPIGAGNIILRATPNAIGWTGSVTLSNDSGTVHVVMGLDSGAGFILDNGAFLLNS